MSTVIKDAGLQVIELHFENSGGQVRVVPQDYDLMAMPVELAIEACRAFKDQIVFKGQFDALLNRIAVWSKERTDKISRAFVTTRDNGLLFLVVLKDKHYNDSIESDLTELDLEIANDSDYDLIRLTVLAIPQSPSEVISSFVSRGMALEYALHGK
jgi:hypothetical protein